MLSLDVCDIMSFFDHFPARTHTDLGDMTSALESCLIEHEVHREKPLFGLLLLQLEGPWTQYAYARRWAGRFTHWVAVCAGQIYDINGGRWKAERQWEETDLAALIRQTPRATGWSVKRGISIHSQDFSAEAVVPGVNLGRSAAPSFRSSGSNCGQATSPDMLPVGIL